MLFLTNDKCETALVSLVAPAVAALPDVRVYPGKSPEDKILPCVVCSADGNGEEDPKGSGNVWIDALVDIKHAGIPDEDGSGTLPEPKALDQALVSMVFSAVMVSDLAEQLSAAVPDFTVFPQGVIFGATQSGRDEKGVWTDRLPIRLYCCGAAMG